MRVTVRVLLVAALAAVSSPTATYSQERASFSNRSLAKRIEQLEAQLDTLNQAGVQPANYEVGCCDAGCGGTGCCDVGCCSAGCCGTRRGGLYVLYENVIVQPFFTRNSAYFLEDPPPVSSGYREVSFDWDASYSPRIEFGSLCDCGRLGWRARYWHFDDSAELNANDANGDIFAAFGDDSIGDLVIDNASEAFFSHSLQMDVVDLEIAFRDCDWTYSAGVRYAHMEQEYLGREIDPSDDNIGAEHDFDGAGLTAAIEVLKPCSHGLSVFAKVRGSALYGESTWLASNANRDSLLENTNDHDMLVAGEFQLGIDWRTCLACRRVFYVTLAVESQYWLNAGTGGPTNNAPFDEGNYQNANPQDADLGFLGGTVGIGFIH